jgi:hypothetical protein
MVGTGVSAQLVDTGWQQGSMFSLAGAQIPFLELEPSNDTGLVVSGTVLGSADRLIVASQTCDILVDAGKEPYVEALLCEEWSADSRLATIINSTRWFRLSLDGHLVACAASRVLISKLCLLEIRPDPFPGSPERLGKFSYWLARRYERPALPNNVVKGLANPLQRTLLGLWKQNPELARLFSQTVQQIRIGYLEDEDGTEPGVPRLHIVFLLAAEHGGLTADQADAIEAVYGDIQERAASADLVRVESHEVVAEEDISLRDYFDTHPVFLDELTYEGDEIVGAEPGKA